MDITTVQTDEARYLYGAALFIEQYGWGQENLFGSYEPPAQMCALGAIGMAMFANPSDAQAILWDEHSPVTVLAEHIDAAAYHNAVVHANEIVADWNDTPGRTAEQVVTELRAAADAYESEHALIK